jgi:hypothetical protein
LFSWVTVCSRKGKQFLYGKYSWCVLLYGYSAGGSLCTKQLHPISNYNHKKLMNRLWNLHTHIWIRDTDITQYSTTATEGNYNHMNWANQNIFSEHKLNLILANEAFKRDFINCIHNLHDAQMLFSWFIHDDVASSGSNGYWKGLCWLATSRICCWELAASTDLKLRFPLPLEVMLKHTRLCNNNIGFINVYSTVINHYKTSPLLATRFYANLHV